MSETREAGTALETLERAGYRCYGAQQRGEVLWQKRVRDEVFLNVTEWPPFGPIQAPRYELDIYRHDDDDAVRIKFYAYDAATLASRLCDLERRALAALDASEVAALAHPQEELRG